MTREEILKRVQEKEDWKKFEQKCIDAVICPHCGNDDEIYKDILKWFGMCGECYQAKCAANRAAKKARRGKTPTWQKAIAFIFITPVVGFITIVLIGALYEYLTSVF